MVTLLRSSVSCKVLTSEVVKNLLLINHFRFFLIPRTVIEGTGGEIQVEQLAF